MHYYQFNIGDYAKATRHLTNDEDLAYRRLIELYYDTEKPLIKDIQKFWILISKESIDIERIEYFLVENAEDLIIDLTWSILNAYKYQTTCSEVIEYLIRKYPREYYKNYKVKSSARGYKSLDSFF